MLAFAFVSYVN